MKKVTAEGKTVEEAIANGLKMLGRPRDQVDVIVLEEPGRGLFGWFGRKMAKVELIWQPDPIGEVRHFLQEMIDKMGVPAQLEMIETEERLFIRLNGDELGLYIGRGGETLQALQYLTTLVFNRYTERFRPVVLEVGDYRQRRADALQQMARRLAEQVVKKGIPIALKPMSAWERRCIHTALTDYRGVYTESRGEGRQRHVVIYPAAKTGSGVSDHMDQPRSSGRFRTPSFPAVSSSQHRFHRERPTPPHSVRRPKDRHR